MGLADPVDDTDIEPATLPKNDRISREISWKAQRAVMAKNVSPAPTRSFILTAKEGDSEYPF